MSHTPWSLATLLVISAVAQAAEGTHPGPLPPPHDAAAGAPTSPDYAYPGPAAEGIGSRQAYGSAPGYGATAGYPQDWAGAPGPGSYGYPAAPGYGQRGGYGYGGYPGPDAATGRGQPRGYWIWVPAEAVESTIGAQGAPQAPYGGHDYGYPAYPSYPGDSGPGGYSVLPPGYAGQGGGAYPDYGSGGPLPGDGWWGSGGTAGPGEPFGEPGAPVGSRAIGTPPRPQPAPAPTSRQSPATAGPAVVGTPPAATEAGKPPAAKDGGGAFRPTTPPAPQTGPN